MNSNERIHKWDNLKCILMFLVVIGHFANQFDENVVMRSVSLFIYSFHMPLFIFVSGLFTRKWTKDMKLSLEKPLYYILIGYMLKIAIYILKISFGRTPRFWLFGDTGIPWFMFAMASFMVITYYLRNVEWIFCLLGAVTISCLAGYINEIGSFLYLSRILVFFPFYYLGYLLDARTMLKIVNHRWLKWASATVLVTAGLICTIYIREIYSYIRLFTARNAYDAIHIADCGAIHRLLWYVIALVLGLAVIALTPSRANKLSDKIGARTLQIYFWHRLILYVMIYSGFARQLTRQFPHTWEILYLGIAVIVTLLLVPNFYSFPLRLAKRWEKKMTFTV